LGEDPVIDPDPSPRYRSHLLVKTVAGRVADPDPNPDLGGSGPFW